MGSFRMNYPCQEGCHSFRTLKEISKKSLSTIRQQRS
jgi:hypothetical protein